MTLIFIPQGSSVSLHKTHIADARELVFSSKQAQDVYFMRHTTRTFNDVSNVKRDGMITLEITMGEAAEVNMLSFNNVDFENKTFYAKVIDFEYNNNCSVNLFYEVDYWQSYMFDIEYYDSMIEREHLSEVLHQKAMANPHDNSIIELRTSEDITLPEEAYTYTNDGNSKWGSPSIVIPQANNDQVFLIQLAPFEFIDESKPPVNKDGKTLNQLLNEYEKKWDGNLTGFEAILKDWSIEDTDTQKDGGGVSPMGNFLVGVAKNYGSISEEDAKMFKNYVDGRTKIIESFKPVKSVDRVAWNEFRSMFPEFKEPHLTQGAAITTYNAILEYNEAGRIRLQQAIDFLTLQGVSASILGIYLVPRYILSETISQGQVVTINSPKPSRVPKLNTGEFNFLSCQIPDGSKREYRYENFRDTSNFKFVVQSSVVGNPAITMAPVNYNQDSKGLGITIENAITFDNFPHLPYSTDGYLTYLSGQIQQAQMMKSSGARLNRSVNNIKQLGTGAIVGGMSGTIVGPTGAIYGALSGMATSAIDIAQKEAFEAAYKRQSDQMYGASASDVQNIKNGNASHLWNGTARAFVQDEYHAGSTNGWLPYLYSGIRFRLDFKYINKEFIERYEKYFDYYGYKSTRFGRPRVGMWALGEKSEEPHWESINGLPCTFIKTDGCSIIGPFLNATRAIENMFNSGIRFIKGDGL